MKRISTFILITLIAGLAFLSCEKTKTETIETIVHDTVFLKDTIFLHDTIAINDTMFLIDSIIFHDTLVLIDTIITHDTVIINDTNEFAYLFKHHELDTYEVLFYTFPRDKSSFEICRMNSSVIGYDVINYGYGLYPDWSQDGEYVYYVDYSMNAIMKKAVYDQGASAEVVHYLQKQMDFLKYNKQLGVFTGQYKDYSGNSRLAAVDVESGEFIELSAPGEIGSRQIAFSEVDDWIYYSAVVDGTKDIYRKKLDGSEVEPVYEDPNYNLTTFNISVDGRFLITPKFKNGKGYIVFYDIRRRSIIHELFLPVDGFPLYACLSRDNKAVFFVNGEISYDVPRNIYRMALDGTQLFQLTRFTDKLANRPLVK